jgi:uncharacterized membrane protein
MFFAVNLGVTVYTMHGSPLYYGIGLTIAGGAMYVAGLLRLMTYVKKIDYHVFCGQPVLAKQKPDGWAKFLGRPNLSKPSAKAVNPKQKENGIKV